MTIHLPEWNEQYHSKHGAIQEARHVFLKMGLYHFIENYTPSEISILEIGFGTGLNAFLSALEAERLKLNINYTGVEAYPVSAEEVLQLNYPEASQAKEQESVFKKIHALPWEKNLRSRKISV